jgi:hypothetical protein
MFSNTLSFLSYRNVNINREIKSEWKRVLVELNMQVACNVRAGGGLRSIIIALYGSALSH